MNVGGLLVYLLWFYFRSGTARADGSEQLEGIEWWDIQKYMSGIVERGFLLQDIEKRMEREFKWKLEEYNISQLEEKTKEYKNIFSENILAIEKLRDSVVKNYDLFKITKPENQCCEKNRDETQDIGCFVRRGEERGLGANPPKQVLKVMQNIRSYIAPTKSLYFAFEDGSSYFYPTPITLVNVDRTKCMEFEARTRPWYKLARVPFPRDILVVLETYESDPAISLKLDVVNKAIDTLTKMDRIIVYNPSEGSWDKQKNGRHVELGVWLTGTARNQDKLKELLSKTFDHQNDSELTNFSNPINETINKQFNTPMQEHINISRKAEKVLLHVGDNNRTECLNGSHESMANITIITYVVGDSRSVLPTSCKNLSRGVSVIKISAKEDLEKSNNTFMSFFKWSSSSDDSLLKDMRITLPYTSFDDGTTIVSTITLPIVINGKFVGVVGQDMNQMRDIENLINIEGFQNSYGFVIDQLGFALFHPLLPTTFCNQSAHYICSAPTYELVNRLEQNKDVKAILQSMVDMKSGRKFVDEGDFILSTGHSISDKLGNPVLQLKRKMFYWWFPLDSIKLSLAIVFHVTNDNKITKVSYNCVEEKDCQDPKIAYHLKSNADDANNCFLFSSNVIRNDYSVKFGPRLFKLPIQYLFSKEDPIQKAIDENKSFMGYLRGDFLNTSIAFIAMVGEVWKRSGIFDCFMGARFFGTMDGIVMFYPGTDLNKTYDQRNRNWFQLAIANQKSYDTISLTTPYRDFLSGSEIISIAMPIQKTITPDFSVTVGVMGGDFSTEFLSHKFRKQVPKCDKGSVRCFLLDALGYITIHFHEKKLHGRHITEAYREIAKELVMSDLLYRSGCHDYEKDAVFLYWHFEMPPGTTTFSSRKGDNSFVIHKIPLTNLFLVGILASHQPSNINESIDCESTCWKAVEPLCKVGTKSSCNNADDMSGEFHEMPACIPSNNAPTNSRAKQSCSKLTKTTCFDESESIPECRFWETTCSEQDPVL